MKVTVKRVGGGPVRFEDFADANGLEMEVSERGLHAGPGARYYAHFKRAEVMERGCLVSSSGNGSTPEEAIADYARELVGKRIAINAHLPERRELQCPTEWLPEIPDTKAGS